jgi:hypothetical protein
MISTAKLTLAIKKTTNMDGPRSACRASVGVSMITPGFFDRNNRYFHVVDGKSHAAAIADFSSLETS